MKKRLLLIPLLLIGGLAIANDGFPEFPMTLYGNIKFGDVDLPEGTLKIYDGNDQELKIYNSSEEELTGWPITNAGKYGSNKATEEHLLLNDFEGPLKFEVIYNGKTYQVDSDSIDDSNKGDVSCPSKDAITFVSANCRYDITINEPTFSLIFNNTDIPTQKVIEGASPQKPEDPERDGYRFDGWYTTPGFTEAFDFTKPITSETNIYAKWVQVFSITFVDEDEETVLKEATPYDYGTLAANIVKPTLSKSADERCNTYIGSWSPAVANVTEDKTYTAHYECTSVKKYSITFVDENNQPVGSALSLEYEASVTAPTVPTKSADNTCTTYAGSWSPAVTNVTKDQEYKATYECTDTKKYSITFVDENNQPVGEALSLEYNDSVTAPNVPVKEGDNTCTTYAGSWAPTVTNVTKDQEYKATYECSVVKQYNITFVDEDEKTVLKETTPYDYGTLAANIVKPTLSKSADERCNTYVGSWSPAVANVTEDKTYTAHYECTSVKKYSITFVDENNQPVGSALSLEYEASVTAPTVPTKAADNTCNTYAGSWSPAVTNVTKDQEYKATYECTDTKKYSITFIDENNKPVGEALSLEYNDPVTAPDVPVKEGDNTCTTYAGSWSPAVANVTKDQEYKATYTCSVVKQYNITFVDEDGETVLKQATPYDYGTLAANIVKPTDPKKDATPKFTYSFAGWTPEITNVTKDATYTAKYNSTINKYTLTFYDDNGTTVLDSQTVDYGENVSYGKGTPTKEKTPQYTYTFSNWYTEKDGGSVDNLDNLTANRNVYARYDSTVNKYDVTFVGAEIEKQTIEYGQKATEPAEPTKAGFLFDGWYKDENYSKSFKFSEAITGTTIVYIKWNEILVVPTGIDAPVLTGSTEEILNIVRDENIPTTNEGSSEGKENVVNGNEVASSNSTASIQGGVEVYPTNTNGDKINNTIIFKKPVLIKIPVFTTGKLKVKVRHLGGTFGYFGLTNYYDGVECDDNGGIKKGTPYNGEEIEVKYETDLFGIKRGYIYIYTCSASEFVAYTETKNPSPSTGGGGGGGGGGSSYSCKNLPDNAVANNKSTPKSNTNYSYSTDTSKVCTFQCKTGYTWNEEKSTCDKSDGTNNNTGDTVKTDETKLNETINNNNGDDKSWYQEGDQSEVLSNGYSREFNNAYRFAYKNGITTMDDISKADINGPLTRVAMAKMLSNYAINILGKKPDTSKIPNFGDVDSKLDSDYNNGVTLAYQLGIMGIGIENFRPFDTVTRAEFGTALSRMLFGLADGTDSYYSTHLAKLKAEGIINNDNPDLKELRGYVMLMLMRSAIK